MTYSTLINHSPLCDLNFSSRWLPTMILLAACNVLVPLCSAEEQADPKSIPDGIITLKQRMIAIPIVKRDGQMYAQAVINKNTKIYFLIDTAADLTRISKTLATKLGLQMRTFKSVKSAGIGGSQPLAIAHLDNVDFGGLELSNKLVAVISASPDPHVPDAILGNDVFGKFILGISNKGNAMLVMDGKGMFQHEPDSVFIPMKFSHEGNRTAKIDVVVNGSEHLSMLIDTGSNRTMIAEGCLKGIARMNLTPTQIRGINVVQGQMSNVTLDSLRLSDNCEVRNCTVVLVPKSACREAFSDSGASGVIGCDLLDKFNYYIDYPHDQFVIVPIRNEPLK